MWTGKTIGGGVKHILDMFSTGIFGTCFRLGYFGHVFDYNILNMFSTRKFWICFRLGYLDMFSTRIFGHDFD